MSEQAGSAGAGTEQDRPEAEHDDAEGADPSAAGGEGSDGKIDPSDHSDPDVWVDRSKIDFDPDDGLLTGTAIEGGTDIPGPHESVDDVQADGDGNGSEGDGNGSEGDGRADAGSGESDSSARDQADSDQADSDQGDNDEGDSES